MICLIFFVGIVLLTTSEYCEKFRLDILLRYPLKYVAGSLYFLEWIKWDVVDWKRWWSLFEEEYAI